MNSRENAFPSKQEGGGNDINGKNIIIPKAAAPSSSSTRPWSILKDPRIVRVSRSFGGKDRHSKVRTIRGLRDRRVRLSVQTALQLYDLQDRLGLNQPSKVVDWLLAAAQHDIDKLPPLPMENFMQYHAQYHQMPMVVSHHDHHFHSSQAVLPSSISSSYNGSTYGKGSSIGAAHQYPFSSTLLIKETSKVEANEENDQINTRVPGKCKGNAVMGSSSTSTSSTHERSRALIKRSEEEGEENAVMGSSTTSTNTLSRQSTTQELLPFASYYHWDYSSLNNPCVGGVLGYSSSSQTDHHDHQEVVPHIGLSSVSSSMGVGPPQLLLCPSIFPAPYNADYDPKYINHFQMVNQGSQNMMPR